MLWVCCFFLLHLSIYAGFLFVAVFHRLFCVGFVFVFFFLIKHVF